MKVQVGTLTNMYEKQEKNQALLTQEVQDLKLRAQNATDAYNKGLEALAKLTAESQTLKNRLELAKGGQRTKGAAQSSGDQEYINLKYEDWKNKMMCLVCKQRENEITLQCGHMTCKQCIDESFNSRQRVCPFDGKRIGKTDIIKIYWNGLTAEDE